jgi:hypothetical protein
MAQETIDFGAYPNDPDSDAIRTAFQKVQNNFTELYAIQYLTGVSQVIPGAGLQVDNTTGNVTITNRIPNITIQTQPGLSIGVTVIPNANANSATITSGSTPFVLGFANNVSIANLTATSNLQGRLNTNSNAQPNITSVGNLVSLSVVGNVNANNYNGNSVAVSSIQATNISSPGATTQLLLNNTGNIGASANLTFSGTLLNLTGSANISGQLSIVGNTTSNNYFGNRLINGNSNITINANSTIVLTSASNATLTVSSTGANVTGIANISGNATAANFRTGGLVSATGNVTGNNFIGNSLINGNSEIEVNLNSNVVIIANSVSTVNITSAGANITGYANISGNANLGNLGTQIITATGNITALNFLTGGNISATGNLISNNINVSNVISATGNIFTANANITGFITATGNITGSNLLTGGIISAGGNITGANIFGTNISATGIINSSSNITAIGNVHGNYFIGNGSQLTGVIGSTLTGTAPSANVSYFANITTSNNANTVNYLPFVNTTSGNANFIADANLNYNPNSKVFTAGALSIVANIAAGNIILTGGANTANSTISVRNITTGANTTTGKITGNWSLTAGSLFVATYADLAEFYAADEKIEPGTVVMFGGEYEIKVCNEQNSTKVAGVVSTEPAYVMNGMLKGDFPTMVALQGRVPVKVTGKIEKGDMLVSAGNGCAMSDSFPAVGSVLGKSLENFDGEYGIIEVAVGRL